MEQEKSKVTYEHVWDYVRTIPAGKATTYGAVAKVLGTGNQVVGSALKASPPDVPWWRVTNAKGHIARSERERRHIAQIIMLELEGVLVRVQVPRSRMLKEPSADHRPA